MLLFKDRDVFKKEMNDMQRYILECTDPNDSSSISRQIDDPLTSVLLELKALREATLPITMGHQVHALFLRLIARTDQALSARLHNEPRYRPFTLSPLLDVHSQGGRIQLTEGQTCYIRITLLDRGYLWHCLSIPLLEEGPIDVRLGEATFKVTRLLSTPAADDRHRIAKMSWKLLSELAPADAVTLSFKSPTAFNINGDYFALFPEPQLVWDSLMRVWNTYAPRMLHVDKQAVRDFLHRHMAVTACALSTHTLRYPAYTQKGFCGHCTYAVQECDEQAAQVTHLAAFASYAGIGYKTTMGMGQTHAELHYGERLR
jgi:CRISPR-associated endoribonuclease Cas6